MGLLFADEGNLNLREKQNISLLQQMGCKLCPLRHFPGRMEPTGATNPTIYVLGEAPGEQEIKHGKQFIGESGQLLRPRIPRKWIDQIRWNNTTRSRPPRNRTPEKEEIEACRPSIVKDIEESRPEAIFGFGNVPLSWAMPGFSGITVWRGRRVPVKIGKHTCWYYPMYHPSFVLRQRRNSDLDDTDIGSEDERMFTLDLKRAFREIEDGLPIPVVHTTEEALQGVETITEGGEVGLTKIANALKWAANQKQVGLDYETNALRPYEAGAKILSVSVSNGLRSIAFPFRHRRVQFNEEQIQIIEKLWMEFLLEPTIKIVHNLSFEMEWTGVKFGPRFLRNDNRIDWEDTASAASILDERKGKNKPGCFALEFLVQQYFGFNLKKISNVDRKNLDNIDLERVLRYNCLDAKYHLALWIKQLKEIKQEGLESVYDLSLRRVPTVVLTQMKGIPIDQPTVVKLQEKYKARCVELEEQIQEQPIVQRFKKETGSQYKPSSNPDTLHIFHKMLGRRECEVVDKYSREKKFSCDEGVLSQIDDPLAKLLLKLRTAAHSKSTYIDPMAVGSELIFPDGLSHGIFNTIFASTGRLSSEAPNWQNFPKRDAESKELRSIVRALKGGTILAFDYGQIEARVIAMATKDKQFCKALWEDYDVHMDWAERIAYAYPDRIGGKKNLTDKKIMKTFRGDVKNEWTFPLFFGCKLESAAGYLNIPASVLKPLYNAFWKEYEGVKKWQGEQVRHYHEFGYVECLTGRRRHGPMSVNELYNSPIQGTAADIVLEAMCRLSETGDPDLQPEINIHDDLTFVRVPMERMDDIAEKVITTMLDVPFDFVNVPISIELSAGPDWADLKEIGKFSSNTWSK